MEKLIASDGHMPNDLPSKIMSKLLRKKSDSKGMSCKFIRSAHTKNE